MSDNDKPSLQYLGISSEKVDEYFKLQTVVTEAVTETIQKELKEENRMPRSELKDIGHVAAIDAAREYLAGLSSEALAELIGDPRICGVSHGDMLDFSFWGLTPKLIDTFVEDQKEFKEHLHSLGIKTKRNIFSSFYEREGALSDGVYSYLFTARGRNLTWKDMLASPLREDILKVRHLEGQTPPRPRSNCLRFGYQTLMIG